MRPSLLRASSLTWFLALVSYVSAVNVYGQEGLYIPGTQTPEEGWLDYFGAYNNTVLQAPAINGTVQNVGLTLTNQPPRGVSVPQRGSFFGFSIEMSVITQVMGINSTFIQVPFLNLLATIADRAGEVRVRYGGNTQETASVVESLPNNQMIAKDKENASNPTDTPILDFTDELIYLLANISSLVNVKWFLGIPLNDTTHPRLQIAEVAERILGDRVIGFQLGNEPDLYAGHGHRDPKTYNQTVYANEIGTMVDAINNDALITSRGNLVVPSLQGAWTLDSIFDTGYFDRFHDAIGIVSTERYPNDNCAVAFPNANLGPPKDPQNELPKYLSHGSVTNLASGYTADANRVIAIGKPFWMFETNTASCGGLPGISDAFAAALWGLDWGLQLAYNNFTGGMFHVGGQNANYNPFTPPPTNLTSFKQWTVGPVFYSVMVIAEALGTTNQSQVLDLQTKNDAAPAYAIYEDGALARLVLINYLSEQNGVGAYDATFSIGGGQTGEPGAMPPQVRVKYLTAPSVTNKNNITWAGQTFGGRFEADGRLRGEEDVRTVNCDAGNNQCVVNVPAPGVALVFIAQDAQAAVDPASSQTYATTAVTKRVNTVTVDPAALATSNGDGKTPGRLGGTSFGAGLLDSHAGRTRSISVAIAVAVGMAGGLFAIAG